MSKGGGAGKVYFVLYLAVVLELLIIIVERDEAEQNLLKKQKETMKIVESILSQLQSGAGTEGINTRPQDEITIPPSGINIKDVLGADLKSFRKYIVEVGVTDVTAELKRKEGESEKEYAIRLQKFIQLGNVEEIDYEIFYSSSIDPNTAPKFPTEEDLKNVNFLNFQPGKTINASDGTPWEFLSLHELRLDKDQTFNRINLQSVTPESLEPVYPHSSDIQIGPILAPKDKEDSVFFYSSEETLKNVGMASTDLKKRSFVVNFQPPNKAGWYKLRFFSRTNRILGVRADMDAFHLSDETNINIGTVTLTVKDLMKVKKELVTKLEKYSLPAQEILTNENNLQKFDSLTKVSKAIASREEDANEMISKISLYGYIVKLLSPGKSIYFPQNRSSIEFDIRVITPKIQQSKPEVVVDPYVPCFDKIPAVFDFTISPFQGKGTNIVDGKVMDESGNTQVAKIICTPYDEIAGLGVAMPPLGQKRDYRGTVENALPPGKYKIKITHRIGSAVPKEETADLEIFKSELTKESLALIKSRLEYVNYGDYFLLVNPIPSSGGKIRPEQFRISLTTDVDPQNPLVQGLSVDKEHALFLSSKAKNATMEIFWLQPKTGQKATIFPSTTAEISQRKPKINPTDNISSVTPLSGTKIRVSIKNIKVAKVPDGLDPSSLADLKVSVSPNVKIGSELTGVDVANEPSYEQEGETYTVNFDLNVNLPRGVDAINGLVTVTVKAEAINKGNGKHSPFDDKAISVNIKYEPEKGRSNRPSGGGGGGGKRR